MLLLQSLLLPLLFATASQALSVAPRVQKWDRSTPSKGDLVVRPMPSSSDEFATIQSAIDALGSAGGSVFVYPGTYAEQVLINKPAVTIKGFTSNGRDYKDNTVTITAGASAAVVGSNDKSGTVRVASAGVSLYNLNIVNTFGHYAQGCQCQAIALSVQAEKFGAYGLRLDGYQDTLLANRGSQFYSKSYISGAVDYIFGQYATAWFSSSDIVSTSRGAITAPGGLTPDTPQLYVFDNCNVITSNDAAANVTGNAFLGRPWKAYGRVVFRNSWLGDFLSPAGWSSWKPTEPNTDLSLLAEYKTHGPGSYENNAAARAPFAQLLTKEQATAYTLAAVIPDFASWVDAEFSNGAD